MACSWCLYSEIGSPVGASFVGGVRKISAHPGLIIPDAASLSIVVERR
jgi:hypothetical protein